MLSATTRRIVTLHASKASTVATSGSQASTTTTTTLCSWRKKNSSPPRFYTSVSAFAVAERVERVLAAKAASGLSYDDLAQRLGVTNTYAAQLCLGQAKLEPGGETAKRLADALPTLDVEDLKEMQTFFPCDAMTMKFSRNPTCIEPTKP